MIKDLINLNEGFSLILEKDALIKEFESINSIFEKMINKKEEPTLFDLEEMSKQMQRATSKIQSIIRRLKNVNKL